MLCQLLVRSTTQRRGPTANAAKQRLLATASHVRSHTALACLGPAVVVVVALIQADVLRSPRTARSIDCNGVERGTHHPLVVDVRARQGHGEWDATPIRQNVAFCAEFSAIGWTRAREVPPLGAFTEALSSDAHSRSSPHLSW